MKKRIIIEGITLAYVEVNPEQSKSLFFIHNNSGSSNIWAKQLIDSDFSKYRLIAIDLPAHGDSSSSDTPELHYGLADLGRIVGKAIKALSNNKNYITIGCSIGSNIILEALAFTTPNGIVLTGPTIVGKEVNFTSIGKPEIDSSPLFSDSAPYESVIKLFSMFLFSKDTALLEELLQDYLKVKAPFRSTMFKQSIANGKLSDEFLLLNEAGVPALIIIGEEEEVIRTDYLDNVDLSKWNSIIYKIPAAGHFVHLDQPKAFKKLLLEYTRDVFREYHA